MPKKGKVARHVVRENERGMSGRDVVLQPLDLLIRRQQVILRQEPVAEREGLHDWVARGRRVAIAIAIAIAGAIAATPEATLELLL